MQKVAQKKNPNKKLNRKLKKKLNECSRCVEHIWHVSSLVVIKSLDE